MQYLFKRIFHATVVLILMTALLGLPLSSAMASENEHMMQEDLNAPKMAVDLLVVRPLGIAATVCGSVVYVLSLPFSAAGGNTKEVYRKTVAEPAAFTFQRPLGHNL